MADVQNQEKKSRFGLHAIGAVVALLLILIVLLLWKQRGSGPGGRTTADNRSPAPEVHLDPLPPPKGILVSGVEHSPTSIKFKVGMSGPTAGAQAEEPLLFCVPSHRAITAKVLSYRRGAETIYEAGNDDATTSATQPGRIDWAKMLKLKDAGIMRRWEISSLELRPEFFAQHKQAPSMKQEAVEAELELRWTEPAELNAAPPFPAETEPNSPWGRVAAALVKNPEALRLFQMKEPDLRTGVNPQITAPWIQTPGDRHWARIKIKDEGIYRLNLDDLITVGFPVKDVRAEAVRLFSRGKPVPLLREGTGAGQKIFFWNNSNRTKYSAERVFWVTLDASLPDPAIEPKTLGTIAGTQTTLDTILRTATFNDDKKLLVENGNFLSIESMEWVDRKIEEEEPVAFTINFPDYAPSKSPLEATVKLYVEFNDVQNQSGRHALELFFNGDSVGTVQIEPATRATKAIEKKFAIPPELVRAGPNEIWLSLSQGGPDSARAPGLTSPANPEANIWFDRMDVPYRSLPVPVDGKLTIADSAPMQSSVYGVPLAADDARKIAGGVSLLIGPDDEPIAAVRPDEATDGKVAHLLWQGVKGGRVECRLADAIPTAPKSEAVSPENLTDEDEGSDYLVIAHHDFIDLVLPLTDMHQAQGLRPRVVDIQNVYDNFSNGEVSPEAIRDFLAYTLGHWKQGAPSYVLLVGDCSSDYVGFMRNSVKNWVPSYTYEFRGDKWASDHWMTVTAGQDDFAEFMLGRISVTNRNDAKTIVDKIVDYTQHPKQGAWRARLGFVADDGEFPPVIEEIRNEHTPPAYHGLRTYLDDEMPLEDNFILNEQYVDEQKLKVATAATASIINSFRKGMTFLTYYGHGSPNIWMEERAWFGCDSENSDNRHLVDTGFCPFVTTMTCNTGAIDYPNDKDPAGVFINISEDMMRVKNGGAIALFVPSGPSVTAIHEKMNVELNNALYGDELRRFGEFTTLARARYAALGQPEQLTYMYILLADPAADLEMTKDVRTFTPAKASFQPGDAVRFNLTGVDPPDGHFVASLETEDEHEIWEGVEATYQGGRIPIDHELPKNARLGPARLRVYAWNETTGKDLAASAEIKIQLPKIEILQARAEIAGNGKPEVRVLVKNTASVPLNGADVKLFRLGEEGSRTAAVETHFTLEADQSTTLTLPVASAPEPKPRNGEGILPADAYEISLTMADTQIGDLLTTYPLTRRAALAPMPEWTGIVAPLSRLTTGDDAGGTQIDVAVLGGAQSSAQWTVGIEDAKGAVAKSQGVTLIDGQGKATFNLRGADADRATSATLWLARGFAATDTELRPMMRVAASQIPRPASHLRIIPGSVRITPEQPTEGETIFVRLEAENIGTAPTRNFSAGLFDGLPKKNGRPLFSQIGAVRPKELPLEPGEKREINLRWDPFKNAGWKSIWIGLDPGRDVGSSTGSELVSENNIHVRTKYILYRGKTTYDKKEIEGKTHYYVLGEVINGGETEAKNVVVQFFRSSVLTPENRIGPEHLIPSIGPKSSVTGRGEWTPDPTKDFLPGVDQPAPAHVIHIKYSQRRISRLSPSGPDAEPDEK